MYTQEEIVKLLDAMRRAGYDVTVTPKGQVSPPVNPRPCFPDELRFADVRYLLLPGDRIRLRDGHEYIVLDRHDERAPYLQTRLIWNTTYCKTFYSPAGQSRVAMVHMDRAHEHQMAKTDSHSYQWRQLLRQHCKL